MITRTREFVPSHVTTLSRIRLEVFRRILQISDKFPKACRLTLASTPPRPERALTSHPSLRNPSLRLGTMDPARQRHPSLDESENPLDVR